MLTAKASSSKPFHHAMIFSGGSFRFGYYLGMYAAAVESDCKPDLIFATCGGAIAAGIIATFEDDSLRKQALLSRETYEMYQRIQLNAKQPLWPILINAIHRYCHPTAIQTVPDLATIALFQVADEESIPFYPYQGHYTSQSPHTPEIAIMGAEVLHPPHTTLLPNQPLFKETIFCSEPLGSLLNTVSSVHSSPLIHKNIQCHSTLPLATAIRISIGDLYYLAPFHWQQKYYIGGMVNLIPYEYADYCADSVTLELKQAYSPYTAVPVFKKLLGFDPNARLRAIHDSQATYWCDTSDSAHALKAYQLQKRYLWWRNQLAIIPPKSYDHYREMMKAQWQYGYQRGIECYQSQLSHQVRMRNVNRLNTSDTFRAQI